MSSPVAHYQLNETQIILLLRRMKYGVDVAQKIETPADTEIMKNLQADMEASIESAKLAKGRIESSRQVNQAKHAPGYLGLHQID